MPFNRGETTRRGLEAAPKSAQKSSSHIVQMQTCLYLYGDSGSVQLGFPQMVPSASGQVRKKAANANETGWVENPL